MKSSMILPALPLYWRLRGVNDPDYSHIPPQLPFTFRLGGAGLLMQERDEQLLGALSNIYGLDYNIGYLQEGYDIAQPYLEDFWGFLLREVESFGRKLRILEVGCGGAILLRRLKDLGHDVVGVDPSPLSARARQSFDLEIHLEMLHPNLSIGTFDLVYSMDVLEHAFEPSEFLEVSLGYLREGGTIVASVPDAGPSIALNEVSCAMHQHLQYFNSATLAGILRALNLSDVAVSTAGYGGSLYARAIAGSNASGSSRNDPIDFAEDMSPNIGAMERNYHSMNEYLRTLAASGKSVGIYAPLRALPYLAGIEPELVQSTFRFIDDTGSWHRRRFDGCSVEIENFSDAVARPPDEFLVFSLTFEHTMKSKISEAGFGGRTQTLRGLLRGLSQ
jgi:2-polyprenyl-3-methyl-5-hydroxy-6-metoxy-1,4-benzoquinol methylase